MERAETKNTRLVFRIAPLVMYEITFSFFVIYYIQGGMTWFKISFVSIAVSFITSVAKIFSAYGQWNEPAGGNKKINTIGLFSNFFFLALYLFCLLVQADQWSGPLAPRIIVIPFLAAPPLIAFAMFLYSDSPGHVPN